MPKADTRLRIEALIAAMTLEEKLGQLTMLAAEAGVTVGKSPPLAAIRAGRAGSLLNLCGAKQTLEAQRVAVEETRLGIPLFFGFDILHGHRTIFPIPLGEAAAFDPDLWERTARCAAEEATEDGIHLTFAPALDVARDPRWGRIVESPGEDPWLAKRFGVAKVQGFQSRSLATEGSIAATAKHFVGYGAVTAGREYASVDISERTLQEIYLPPFHAAVDSGVAAIMPAFTDLSGIPLSANVSMLRELLRGQWGFDGLIISDYNAIAELMAHGVAGDIADAAALALKAGIDVDMMADAYLRGLPIALQRGLITMADIDGSVRRVLGLKAQLGLFEDPYKHKRPASPPTPGSVAARRRLAREAARRSIVLLTNRGDFLPLTNRFGLIAIIGPLVDAPEEMIGPWSAAGTAEDTISLRQGIQGILNALPTTSVEWKLGVPISGDDDSGIPEAIDLARRADVTILFVGESRSMSGEASSRAHPVLPGRQEDLVRAVLKLGKPVVVLVASGRPLILPSWLVAQARAVLATWFLGSEAGNAIADVLTGASNPTGRLPVSWPVAVGQIPIFFASRPTGRPADPAKRDSSKYLDLPVEPLFTFGHGLSYSKFLLSNLRVEHAEIRPGSRTKIMVDICNISELAGEENILLFIRDPVATVSRPVLELRGMYRIALAPGAMESVQFSLSTDDLMFLGLDMTLVLETGTVELFVGPSAAQDVLLKTSIYVVTS